MHAFRSIDCHVWRAPMPCLFVACAVAFCASTGKAAADRPDIVVVMVDDLGFSDIGAYGGEIDTPHIDRLASNGLRYSQFYNAGRCCPTRAAMLTGLYPHKTGLGYMTARDYGKPGYRADLNWQCVTIPEVLRTAGYHTAMVGKWHLCHDFRPAGPKHNWPLQRGFDRFYGTLIAAGSLWNPPTLTEGNKPAKIHEDFYFTEALTDKAIEYIEETPEDKSLFLYVAHPAPHWPLHARQKRIDKYRGRFSAGWDALRSARLERLHELGLVDEAVCLSPREPAVTPWAATPNRNWQQRRMEAYAAMVDHVDQSVGRLVESLKTSGRLENTLLLFFSDNGGESLEHPDGKIGATGLPWPVMRYVPLWTHDRRPVIAGDFSGLAPGPANTFAGYGRGWANLSNTPFRKFKKFAHEGGIATPLIVHWPKAISARNAIRHQPAHVIDIMATCVDVANAEYPAHHQGEPIRPLDGVSLADSFASERVGKRTLFWEHEGNRAVRQGRWKIVSAYPGDWELYDLANDRTETLDLAHQHQSIVRQLAEAYDKWAAANEVIPWKELAADAIAPRGSPLRRTEAEMQAYWKALQQHQGQPKDDPR